MANTFELIASSTVGSGGAASIDFTSIASTWTDLCLKASLRSSDAAAFVNYTLKFNGSGGTAYSVKLLYGTGSSATSASSSGVAAGDYGFQDGAGATASTFANVEIYIPNYAGSNYKSWSTDQVQENNATAAYAGLLAGLWSNTAAINQVTLTSSAGNFVQYSTAYLYGVKNA
jgi:hypothetical protein